MNCSEVKKLIQLYMDNELEARDTLEVQRHLEACSSCNRALQVLTDQDEKLRTAARAETVGSVILRDKVVQAIRQAERPIAVKRRAPLGGLVGSVSVLARVAAIVLVAGLSVLILLESGILHGAQNAVYADAIRDHQDHCMLENTADRMYT
ncbi:MAG: anti-sigma factor family protein, partial [Blastocatellia bacterium]